MKKAEIKNLSLEEEIKKSLVFVKTPADWPMWPYLPVKKMQNNNLILGCILEQGLEGVTPKIYAINAWAASTTPRPWPVRAEYATFEELFADGWRVD